MHVKSIDCKDAVTLKRGKKGLGVNLFPGNNVTLIVN